MLHRLDEPARHIVRIRLRELLVWPGDPRRINAGCQEPTLKLIRLPLRSPGSDDLVQVLLMTLSLGSSREPGIVCQAGTADLPTQRFPLGVAGDRNRDPLILSGAGIGGMPQLTAISTCAEAAQSCGVSLIADGGIRYSGDITKALACGASAVMLGGLLAGLHESPGEIVIREGRSFKEYRGMGSIGAMKGRAADRYASAQSLNGASPDIGGKTVPEGIEGQVPYKGFLNEFVFQLLGGLRSGMGYVGAQNLPDLWRKARFVRISPAGYQESHPHSVVITKEAPNYQVNPGN